MTEWARRRGRRAAGERGRRAHAGPRRDGAARTRHLICSLIWGLTWGLLALPTPQAAEQTLWGYGVRPCEAYLAALSAAQSGHAGELTRYEDWLTGFVSALSLALGEDVLRDAELTAAMRGVRAACEDDRDQDFFNATMDFIRRTGRLP